MKTTSVNRVIENAPVTREQRKAYTSPKLTTHGDVRSLTQVAPGKGGNCSQLKFT